MKKSIVRLLAFSVVPFLVICYSVYLINQKTDDFYKRFTSPQQNSLILGSSRAASMNPQILDSLVNKKFPKVKLSSKDTIARLKKKITKVYKVNDEEDFYLDIHRFSSMYPF